MGLARRKGGYLNLRDFTDDLRWGGELVEVEVPVDPCLEIAEIHRRVIAAGGPALLFTNPLGSDFPVLTNLFGTARRAEMAFGRRPRDFVRRVVETVETFFPPTLGKAWNARDLAMSLAAVGTRKRRRGPLTEKVKEDFDLRSLPALTCWPEDGGPFLTLPLVYTCHPEGKAPNLGMYRMQIHSQNTTGMHWQIGKGGGFHYRAAEGLDQVLPVTVFLGGPPALILGAVAPLPENIPEILLASLIAGHKIGVVEGFGTHPLFAEAEFALIGVVPPHIRKPEGPFGDHYGYYSLRHDYPVFEVQKVVHRRNAIYPATVVGKPRQEDFYVGDLLQELLSPLFPLIMPSVEELWSYGETGYHSLTAARVKERYKREAMMSAFRILGEGQLSLTKFLLVVDQPVDLRDFRATLAHLLARTCLETDLYVFSNLSMDTLDYTGPAVNEGSKGIWMGIGDPVRELPAAFSVREIPPGASDILVFCPGCLVTGGPRFEVEPEAAARFARHPAFQQWPLVVLSDEPGRAAASTVNFLWTTFTRFEPNRDIYSGEVRVVRNQLARSGPIVLDARYKPGFPAELHCSKEIAERVSRRWKEYFPSGMEMGDSESAHLDR